MESNPLDKLKDKIKGIIGQCFAQNIDKRLAQIPDSERQDIYYSTTEKIWKTLSGYLEPQFSYSQGYYKKKEIDIIEHISTHFDYLITLKDNLANKTHDNLAIDTQGRLMTADFNKYKGVSVKFYISGSEEVIFYIDLGVLFNRVSCVGFSSVTSSAKLTLQIDGVYKDENAHADISSRPMLVENIGPSTGNSVLAEHSFQAHNKLLCYLTIDEATQYAHVNLTFFFDDSRTDSEFEDIITAELIDGQSIDNRIDELIAESSIGLSLFLQQNSDAVETDYRIMCHTYPDDAKTEIFNVTISADNQEIEQFLSGIGCPGITILKKGYYSLHCHTYKYSGEKDAKLYFKLYKYESDTTETLLGTSVESEVLEDTESEEDIHLHITDNVIFDITDRLIVKVFARLTGTGNNPVVYFYVEGETLARLSIPVGLIETTHIEEVITAELVDGQSIDNRIDALIAGSGHCYFKSGTYTGNSGSVANNRQITGFGFTPSVIRIVEWDGDEDEYLVHEDFPAWECIVVANGAATSDYVLIIADGMELDNGAGNSRLNTQGKEYYYYAMG